MRFDSKAALESVKFPEFSVVVRREFPARERAAVSFKICSEEKPLGAGGGCAPAPSGFVGRLIKPMPNNDFDDAQEAHHQCWPSPTNRFLVSAETIC
jgi:hypothetical protein